MNLNVPDTITYKLHCSFSSKKVSNGTIVNGYTFYIHKTSTWYNGVVEKDVAPLDNVFLTNEQEADDLASYAILLNNIIHTFGHDFASFSKNLYINPLSLQALSVRVGKKEFEKYSTFNNFLKNILCGKIDVDFGPLRIFLRKELGKKSEKYVSVIDSLKRIQSFTRLNKLVVSVKGESSSESQETIRMACFNKMIEVMPEQVNEKVEVSPEFIQLQNGILQRRHSNTEVVKKVYEIFTDASINSDSSKFGYSAVITELKDGEHIILHKIAGMKRLKCKMQIQLAEMTAIEQSLMYLKTNISNPDEILVRVYCDNDGCVESLSYSYKWSEKMNTSLIFDLTHRIKAIEMTKTFAHIKGHFGHKYNEMADKIAGWAKNFKEEKMILLRTK